MASTIWLSPTANKSGQKRAQVQADQAAQTAQPAKAAQADQAVQAAQSAQAPQAPQPPQAIIDLAETEPPLPAPALTPSKMINNWFKGWFDICDDLQRWLQQGYRRRYGKQWDQVSQRLIRPVQCYSHSDVSGQYRLTMEMFGSTEDP